MDLVSILDDGEHRVEVHRAAAIAAAAVWSLVCYLHARATFGSPFPAGQESRIFLTLLPIPHSLDTYLPNLVRHDGTSGYFSASSAQND